MINSDPEPQLIPQAIAAFSENNQMREWTLGLSPHQTKLMP
jgi:hypothetical protein